MPGGLLLYCDHYFEPATRKNPRLHPDRAEQRAALIAAGFTRVEELLDEGGMSLYAALVL